MIKKSLLGLTPLQLGALRIVITGLLLLAFGFKSLKTIRRHNYKWIVATGLLGTFFPVFLFSYAETEVDSSIVSILNSLVPLNTVLFGLAVFKITTTKRQVVGVIIGFIGTMLLIASGAHLNPHQNYLFAGLVIIATVMYAINVNIIKKYLFNEAPLAITSGNFVVIIIPAFVMLLFSDFFSVSTFNKDGFYESMFYIVLLSIFGTAIAKVLFTKLVHISSPVFASSVTYVMPLVAVLWGLLDGERISFIQVLGGVIILLGVYLSNRQRSK